MISNSLSISYEYLIYLNVVIVIFFFQWVMNKII